jgi:REP element-mobilizing transposase RayT
VRRVAKAALKHPEVCLSGRQALAVGKGFRNTFDESGYVVHACSILPQHVHLIVGPSPRSIRRIVGHLKARATQQLERESLHPLAAFRQPDGRIPSPWARNCLAVYIFSEAHLIAAIQYVENNPVKEGKPRQKWSFVTPYLAANRHVAARSKLRR